MKCGELINTITFYKTQYIDNGDGTGKNELVEIRKVKGKVSDITYKDIEQGKRKDIKRTLKVYTYYFKEFKDKGLKAKINNGSDIYEIIYRENVGFKNRELIFTFVKPKGTQSKVEQSQSALKSFLFIRIL